VRSSGLLVFAVLVACRTPPAPAPSPLASSSATPASSAPASSLSVIERTRLIAAIGQQLEAHYVFPDVGTRMAKAVLDKAASGGYNTATTEADFARVVTDDLRAISHDKHAMLDFKATGGPATAEEQKWAKEDAENERTAGFGVVERLPGNVARVVLNAFQPGDGVKPVVTQHMTEVADASALIIDLRDNGGGDPAIVAWVASYLFDPPRVHLNDMWWRDDGSTFESWTVPDVPGKRFGSKKPVYVLTSSRTFSAGEEFAYDLQVLHRATIIGETTKGGAHPVDREKLSPTLTLRVPTGRAINPITKTNWEGVGVKPDVAVPADKALEEALTRAGKGR
jgi:C-terminal processing protease CtpA/Prc